MTRKIIGTDKFIIYLYNGQKIRGGDSKANHFAYKQSGVLWVVDENGKEFGKKQFSNFGQMIDFMTKHMRKKVQKNLKVKRSWK